MMRKLLRLILFLALIYQFTSCNNTPGNGDDIVTMMYNKWSESWPQNVYLKQITNFYKGDSIVKSEIWQEAIKSPGNLHVRIGEFEEGNGMIFFRDSMFVFKDDILDAKKPLQHFLLILCFDVYFNSPDKTLEILKNESFNTDEIHIKSWNGKEVYVVGTTNPEDLSSNQFWIDKENLWVCRVIKQTKTNIRNYEIGAYQQIEGQWIATELIFKTDDKVTMTETYYDISFPDQINDDVFNPNLFNSINW